MAYDRKKHVTFILKKLKASFFMFFICLNNQFKPTFVFSNIFILLENKSALFLALIDFKSIYF